METTNEHQQEERKVSDSGDVLGDLCKAVEEVLNPVELFYYFDKFNFATYPEKLMEQLYPDFWDRYNAVLDKLRKHPDIEVAGEDNSVDSLAMEFGKISLHIGLIVGYLFALKAHGADSETLRRQAEVMIRNV